MAHDAVEPVQEMLPSAAAVIEVGVGAGTVDYGQLMGTGAAGHEKYIGCQRSFLVVFLVVLGELFHELAVMPGLGLQVLGFIHDVVLGHHTKGQ